MKYILFILINTLTLSLFAQIVCKKDLAKNQYYLFDQREGKAITKPIYDKIYCNPENVTGAVLVKDNKYGIYYFTDTKLEIIPMGSNKIQWLYDNVFLVEKKGKYAVLTSKNNISYDASEKKTTLKKDCPKYESDFIFTDAIITDSAYYYAKKILIPGAPLVLLKKPEGTIVLNILLDPFSKKEVLVQYEIVKPILVNKYPQYIVKQNGKYGLVNRYGFLDDGIKYDSIFPILGCEYTADGSSKSYWDEIVVKKGGRYIMMRDKPATPMEIQLQNITLIDEKPTYEYGKLSKYFLNQPSIEIIERLKIGENKYPGARPLNILIIKKDGMIGMASLTTIIIQPTYSKHKIVACNGYDKEISHIAFYKNDRVFLYDIFKNLNATPHVTNEPYLDFECSNGTLIVKKEDSKWYFYNVNGVSPQQVGYDRIVGRYDYGPAGFLGNKVHQYRGDNYVELEIPEGAIYYAYIDAVNGFFYRKDEKYGFKSPTKNIAPVLPSFSILQDEKEKIMFATKIDEVEYIFYLDEIITPTRIKSFNECEGCLGKGYIVHVTKTSTVIKGKETTRSERVYLWRDGEYTKTTTTKEPDRVVEDSDVERVTCTKCKGTKKQTIYLSVVNGLLKLEK